MAIDDYLQDGEINWTELYQSEQSIKDAVLEISGEKPVEEITTTDFNNAKRAGFLLAGKRFGYGKTYKQVLNCIVQKYFQTERTVTDYNRVYASEQSIRDEIISVADGKKLSKLSVKDFEKADKFGFLQAGVRKTIGETYKEVLDCLLDKYFCVKRDLVNYDEIYVSEQSLRGLVRSAAGGKCLTKITVSDFRKWSGFLLAGRRHGYGESQKEVLDSLLERHFRLERNLNGYIGKITINRKKAA